MYERKLLIEGSITDMVSALQEVTGKYGSKPPITSKSWLPLLGLGTF